MSVIENDSEQEAIEDALQCLAFSHQWDRVSPLQRERRARHMGYRIHWRCMRCASERIDTCNLYGQLLYRDYKYSKAFKAVNRPNPSEAYTRKELFRRSYIKALK